MELKISAEYVSKPYILSITPVWKTGKFFCNVEDYVLPDYIGTICDSQKLKKKKKKAE